MRFLRHAYFKPIQSWVLHVGFQVLLPIFPSYKQFQQLMSLTNWASGCTQNSVEKSMCSILCILNKPIAALKVIVCWEPTSPVFLVWNLQRLNVQVFLNILGAEPEQFLPFPSGCKVPYVKCTTVMQNVLLIKVLYSFSLKSINTGLFPEMTEEFTWVFGLGLCP